LTGKIVRLYGRASRRDGPAAWEELDMQVSTHWRTASLVAGALLIGSVIGTPLAQAVSAGLVRIEGGHNANLAAVSSSGRLSVNAGLTTTPSGQAKVALASPADSVEYSGFATCSANGFATIPAGKALIITGATFYNAAASAGNPHHLTLTAGPPAEPCHLALTVSAAPTSVDIVSQNQVFSPGIAVPAGDVLGLNNSNDVGGVFVFGYLVPARAVPHNALRNLTAPVPGGSMAIKPRH
jgi:hypothetical protein